MNQAEKGGRGEHLYNTELGELIRLLEDGDEIFASALGDRSLSIAITGEGALFDETDSARLNLNDGGVTRPSRSSAIVPVTSG